jgi:hypothetical protein
VSRYTDGLGLDDRVSIPGRGKIFFFTPQGPDRRYGEFGSLLMLKIGKAYVNPMMTHHYSCFRGGTQF